MRLKNSDAFDIRSLSSDATNIHEASSILEDRDELGSVGGDSVGDEDPRHLQAVMRQYAKLTYVYVYIHIWLRAFQHSWFCRVS